MINDSDSRAGRVPSSTLFIIIFIVFLDILGMTLIIPILAPVFLDKATTILDPSVSYATRTVLLGFLLSAYPLAQFFGAPLLGALSDRYGRRKVIFISLAGALVGYVMFGYGIIFGSLPVLFFARIIEGFLSGNISAALSVIADISTSKTKTKNFGLVGVAYGAGLVIGPFLGGILSDSRFVSWFTHATPFLFAALLIFINMLLMLAYLPETLKKRIDSPLSFFTGFKNIGRAFRMKNLRAMFLVVFFIMLGFTFFTHFLPALLIEKFNYDELFSGYFFAYLGLWLIISQGLIVRWVSKRLSPARILSFSILAYALSYGLFIIPDKSLLLYIFGPLIAIFNGLTLPSYNALISDLGEDDSQGEILGINQSMQSLASAIPPIISGFLFAFHPNLPTVIAAVATFIAWLFFIFFFRGSREEKFKEV